MTERQRERAWMVIAVIVISSVFLIGMGNKADSMTIQWALQEIEDAGWCDNNDDMVKDSNGVCHDIDSYIDAWVDANPPQVLPHLADQCQEDEDYTAVHYETPGAVDDIHGVTRMCRPVDDIIMDGINELILDGTLIWEWDL